MGILRQYSFIAASALLLFAGASGSSAQVRTAPWAVRAGADRLTIGNFRDSYTQKDFNSYTLEWNYLTESGHDGSGYAAAYNFPVFGIGVTYNSLQDVQFRSAKGHYSEMFCAYGSMSRDLLVHGPLSFGYNSSLGLSYSEAYYNPVTNSSNWFFGAPVVLYATFGGHLTWQVTRRFDLEAGISFRHNSSARTAYPNGGLNYWGGGLSARYSFQDKERPEGWANKVRRLPSSAYRKGWSYEIYAGGGVHACAAEWLAYCNTVDNQTLAGLKLRRWPMASLSADAIYRTGSRFGLGFTVDGFYNSNTEMLRWADDIIYGEGSADSSKGYARFSCGAGIVQEVFYKHVAFYLQECLYLYRHMGIHGDHGIMYERAGFRVYPPSLDPFFLSVCIKAHMFKADYLDFTIGVRL